MTCIHHWRVATPESSPPKQAPAYCLHCGAQCTFYPTELPWGRQKLSPRGRNAPLGFPRYQKPNERLPFPLAEDRVR